MKLDLTFTQSELHDGDIICFQTDITDGKLPDLESQGLYSDPPQFYDAMFNRVVVLFKPRFNLAGHNQPEFSLILKRTQDHEAVGYHFLTNSKFCDPFSQMATKVGEHLKHDPIKLRFATTDAANGKYKDILKRGLNQKIADIISPSSSATVILYEKLETSVIDLEARRWLRVTWTGLGNIPKLVYLIMLPHNSTVNDLLLELSDLLQSQLTPTGTGRFRLYGVAREEGTKRSFTVSDLVKDIPDSIELYAEEIPRPLLLLIL